MIETVKEIINNDTVFNALDIGKINFSPLPDEDIIIGEVRSWDLSNNSNSTSYTVGSPLYYSDNGNLLLNDFVFNDGGYNKKLICEIARRDGFLKPILLDTGFDDMYFKELKSDLTTYTVNKVHKGIPKSIRHEELASLIRSGNFYVDIDNSMNKKLLFDELKFYPKTHDDILDSIAYGYNWLKHNSPL